MRTFLLLAFSFIVFQANAQQIRYLTLEEATKIALENVIEIKNLQLDEQIQQAQNKEITGSALPQISGSGQMTYYTNLPVIPFPASNFSVYNVLEKEGVQDKNGNPISVNNATSSVQAVSFVAPLNYQFGLSVQQLLFQPDVFVALKARETILEFAKNNTTIAADKVKESVQKAYYAVLIAQNQKTVINQTKVRLEKLKNEMAEMFKQGFAEKLDIDKLTVTVNNTEAAQNQINNGIKISEAVLKNALGIPQTDSIVLSDKLDIVNLQAEILNSEAAMNYENRSEYSLLMTTKKLQTLEIKRFKMSYLPTVAAFYQLQRSGQRNEIYDINGSGPWFAFTTGLAGISINQPIYDGGQKSQKIQQSKLKLQKLENSITQLKQYIDLENVSAKNSLKNAVVNLEVQKRNMELAESVFNTTTKKYQSGLGSSFELIQTDTELQRATGSYFQALYDAYIAKVNFIKSIGKL